MQNVQNLLLFCWIIMDTDSIEEANSFYFNIYFFDSNGKCCQVNDDTTKPLLKQNEKHLYGNVASIISLKKLKGSFPRPTTNFSINDTLQFERKLFCPKLDEVAKDENVESGVEDTDEESKD